MLPTIITDEDTQKSIRIKIEKVNCFLINILKTTETYLKCKEIKSNVMKKHGTKFQSNQNLLDSSVLKKKQFWKFPKN